MQEILDGEWPQGNEQANRGWLLVGGIAILAYCCVGWCFATYCREHQMDSEVIFIGLAVQYGLGSLLLGRRLHKLYRHWRWKLLLLGGLTVGTSLWIITFLFSLIDTGDWEQGLREILKAENLVITFTYICFGALITPIGSGSWQKSWWSILLVILLIYVIAAIVLFRVMFLY